MAAELNAALASGNLVRLRQSLSKVSLDDLNKVYNRQTRLNKVRRLAKNKGKPFTDIGHLLEEYGALTYNNSKLNIMKNLAKYQHSVKLAQLQEEEDIEPYSPPIGILSLESPPESPQVYLSEEVQENVYPYSPDTHPYLTNLSRLNSPRPNNNKKSKGLPPLYPSSRKSRDLVGYAVRGGKRTTMRRSRKTKRFI